MKKLIYFWHFKIIADKCAVENFYMATKSFGNGAPKKHKIRNGLFLCRERIFENLKVDSSELVTMTTDGIPAGVSVHIAFMKHKHYVTRFYQDTKFKPIYFTTDQKPL
jgi:hypothetical protein